MVFKKKIETRLSQLNDYTGISPLAEGSGEYTFPKNI